MTILSDQPGCSSSLASLAYAAPRVSTAAQRSRRLARFRPAPTQLVRIASYVQPSRHARVPDMSRSGFVVQCSPEVSKLDIKMDGPSSFT